MPNGGAETGYALDDVSRGFRSLERTLGQRATQTSRARQDAHAIRALTEAWFRTFRPAFAGTLGSFPAIDTVDQNLGELLRQAGARMVISDVRARLRAIARALDQEIVPAYNAARWTGASARQPADIRPGLLRRLEDIGPELGLSYTQVHVDLVDEARVSFLGPAGEIREVMRAVIHHLAPEEAVRTKAWYVGHEGRPMQAERIRYILEERSETETSAAEAAEVVDTKVATFGRQLYQRANRAFHAGAQREELGRIVGYVEAVLNEILPP